MADVLKLVRTLPDGHLVVVEANIRNVFREAYRNGVCVDDILDSWADTLDRKTWQYYHNKPANTVPVSNTVVVNTDPVPVPNTEPVANVEPVVPVDTPNTDPVVNVEPVAPGSVTNNEPILNKPSKFSGISFE